MRGKTEYIETSTARLKAALIWNICRVPLPTGPHTLELALLDEACMFY